MVESRFPSPLDERVKLQRAQRAWIANNDRQRTPSGDLGAAAVAAKPAQLDSQQTPAAWHTNARWNQITRECSTNSAKPRRSAHPLDSVTVLMQARKSKVWKEDDACLVPDDPSPVDMALQTLSRLDTAQLRQVVRHLHATLESGQDDAQEGMHGELYTQMSEAQGMLERLPAEVFL
jgi:hypothetical protein